MRTCISLGLAAALVVACGADHDTPSDGGGLKTYGDSHAGEYNLGPVEWSGSFNNSCSPYTSAIESEEGDYLAGLGLSFNGDGSLCDSCILVQTNAGKSLVLRVVTTGTTTAPNNIDVSQAAYTVLSAGEFPRSMTWQLVECPAAAAPSVVEYQFQTQANVDWTSLWVRNARAPISKLEVKSAKHASFTELTRGSDGTFTDNGGFGAGPFTLRVTAMDGQTVSDTFPTFAAGDLLQSSAQFP